jgi:hypothetical protein
MSCIECKLRKGSQRTQNLSGGGRSAKSRRLRKRRIEPNSCPGSSPCAIDIDARGARLIAGRPYSRGVVHLIAIQRCPPSASTCLRRDLSGHSATRLEDSPRQYSGLPTIGRCGRHSYWWARGKVGPQRQASAERMLGPKVPRFCGSAKARGHSHYVPMGLPLKLFVSEINFCNRSKAAE